MPWAQASSAAVCASSASISSTTESTLAASATAFHHLCDLPAMRDKRVLLIWNKTDAPCALRDAETAAFDAARAETALKDALTTIQVSALDGSNAEQVMTWIRGVYGV